MPPVANLSLQYFGSKRNPLLEKRNAMPVFPWSPRPPTVKEETKEVPEELKDTTKEQRAFLRSIGAIGESMTALLASTPALPCCSSRKSSVRKTKAETSSNALSQSVDTNQE